MSDKQSDKKSPEAISEKIAAPAKAEKVSVMASAQPAAKVEVKVEAMPSRRAPSKPGTRKPAISKASKPKASAPKAKTAAQKPAAKKAVKAKKPVTPKKSAPRKTPNTGVRTMTAKKETAQETFETVTAASNKAIKEGFEKSLTAMNDASAFNKDTVDAVIASATTASKSIEELNANTVAFTKKSLEDGVSAAKAMASAKSVQEVIEIQAGFTKSSLDAYLAEVNKASDLVSGMFKESFQPLNDRFSAAVELMQSQR